MALVLKTLYTHYQHAIFDLGDPRTVDYPLMKSPVQIVFLLTAYVLFVKNVGPKLMEKREPFNLKFVIVCFNLIQILLNLYLAIKSTFILLRAENFFCIPIDYGYSKEALEIKNLFAVYFYVKISDLLDTVFFVLRKKYNQVTFLHLYHHTLMVAVVWMLFRYFAGGHTIYTGIFNCYVHVAMYSYYLLSTFDEKYRASTAIKKNITRMQLLQFILVYVFYFPMIFMPSCTYPKSLLLLFIPQNTMMILLFSDFYYKAYVKKKRVN